ncbi:hypothetical protein BGW39_005010, partial [Mortierella sp. 14UC]
DRNLFVDLVSDLVTGFPKIKSWLNWYLNPVRGSLIFPALSDVDFSHLARDTNAQESIGAEFKKLLPVGTLDEAIVNIASLLKRYETCSNLRKQGITTSHRKSKKIPVYVNDGRAPAPDAPNDKTYDKLFAKEPNSIDFLL